MKILNQWRHPLCSAYSVLGALQYYEPNLDVNGVLEELHKNTMATHMAARNWFKSQGLIEDMVQVHDWQAKILLKRGEPILTWGTWVNWQETKVPPFYITWWNDNAVIGHYWYIDGILPWEGDKKNPMTKMANSYWEGWADKGYFYGPLINPKYKQKWKIIPKKKEEHNDIIRAWVGKSVDVDNYPEYWPHQCFTAWHRILMENWEYKKIEDIIIWDRVVGKNWINTVIQLHQDKKKVVETKTKTNTFIHTKDHPFLMTDWSFQELWEIKNWYDPDLYKWGEKEKSWLTDNELLFLWFWLWDWNLSEHKDNRQAEIKFTYWIKKKPFIDKINITASEKFHHHCKNAYIGILYTRKHPLLWDIIRKCYNEKREKIFRFNFTDREMALVLEWFANADWYIDKRGRVSISNTSIELLLKMQSACFSLWYSPASIRKRSSAWEITTMTWFDGVKFPITRKKDCYTLNYNPNRSYRNLKNILKENDLYLDTVYNIWVDGDHTYVCNNHYVHNCVDWVRFYTNTRKRYITNYGNAYDLWLKGLGKGWERINNTGWAVPQEGDVILWWPTWGGGYGHIAVANKYCNRLFMRYTDQNGGKGKGQGKSEDVITNRFGTYSGVVGWFHWNG